jgi:predicted ATPase
VEGEQVYKLAPLACPLDDRGLTAAAAQTFPAVQLSVERAVASGARLKLDDLDAAVAASICRKLDGVPLAIELAAGRVEAYGLQQTAVLLERRLTLLGLGQRTAAAPADAASRARLELRPAHGRGTHGAASARRVCRPLHDRAALAVVPSGSIDEALVFGAIDSLVAKSMVATRPAGATMRYQLLDTTRAYVLEVHSTKPSLRTWRHATRPTTGAG